MIRQRIQIAAICGWTALGFYRGVQHHNYIHQENLDSHRKKLDEHARDMERYTNDKLHYPTIYFRKPDDPPTQPVKYFISDVAYGCHGVLYYICPLSMPFYFVKECYRVETYIRGFECEKHKKYYRTLDIVC